jgi:hypothetical protein
MAAKKMLLSHTGRRMLILVMELEVFVNLLLAVKWCGKPGRGS